MKIFKKIIILVMLIIYTNFYIVAADELNMLENTLQDIGIPKQYSENITNYVENVSVSQEQLNVLLENSRDIMNIISQHKNIKELKMNEIMGIYNEVNSIAKELNLSFSYNFFSGKIKISDKITNEILFQGTLSDLKQYYENLSKITISEDIIDLGKELLNDISDNKFTDNIKTDIGIIKNNNKDIVNSAINNTQSNTVNNASDNNDITEKNEIMKSNQILKADGGDSTSFSKSTVLFVVFVVIVIAIIIVIIIKG